MPSQRIRKGEEGYTQIHSDWVSNGRPRQFTREGGWGGALYRVRFPENVGWDSKEYPDFYQASSLGPTVTDDTDAGRGKVVEEGWHLINQEEGYSVEVSERDEPNTTGKQIKTEIKDMPNELSVEETL